MSPALTTSDLRHAGLRGLLAAILLVPWGVLAASSYSVAASGYAFAISHFQQGSLALLPPLAAFLGLLAIPAGLLERRAGAGDKSLARHAGALSLTAVLTPLGLLLVAIQASYLLALWQVGLTPGWSAAAERARELVRLVGEFPVDSAILATSFATPYVVIAALRLHDARGPWVLSGAALFSASLAALVYAPVAPVTQQLAWLGPDSATLARPRLILTWACLVGSLAFALALAALGADVCERWFSGAADAEDPTPTPAPLT